MKALYQLHRAAWREALRVRATSLYATMRALSERFGAQGSFLITAVRLGGQHGYDPAGALAPMGGAVVGLTKSVKRERPDGLVKAVDFELETGAEQIANRLLAEHCTIQVRLSIGYKDGLRWTVGLQEQPSIDGRAGLPLNHETVFLVTGAAGSIVSAITADLAAASGGIFYLLDVVPKPDPANEDIKRFAADKEGLKRDLADRLKTAGKRVTPAMAEKELAALERAQAAKRQSMLSDPRAALLSFQRQPHGLGGGGQRDQSDTRATRPHRCATACSGTRAQSLPS